MPDLSSELKGTKIVRQFRIREVDTDARTVALTFSSDGEVEMYPGVMEVLNHSAGAVDLSRLQNGAGPVLWNHDRDVQVGVVESAEIKDGKGHAVIRLSRNQRGEELLNDIADRIISNVSVGYRVLKSVLTEDNEDEDRLVYTTEKWMPYEISLVSIPADPSVGVGRILSLSESFKTHLNRKMGDDANTPQTAVTEPTPERVRQIEKDAERKAEERLRKKFDEERKAEEDRRKAILDAGSDAFKRTGDKKLEDLAREHAEDKAKSVHDFNKAAFERLMEPRTQANEPLGLSRKDVKEFSFMRLLLAASEPNSVRLQEEAAHELRVCREESERKNTSRIAIPVDVLRSEIPGFSTRDVTSIKQESGYAGTGGNLVQTTLLSGNFIELLRNSAVLMRISSTLGGLMGDIDIPKQASALAAYWLGEDDEATQSDATFDQISMTPHTIGARAALTRKLLKNGGIDTEAFIRREIASRIGLKIDLDGFYGTGAANAPSGLLASGSGINAVTFAAAGAPTHAELVQMETEIASDNADIGSMRYVTDATIRGYAKTTLKAAGVSGYLWEPGNTINGYPVEVTNQIIDGDVIFGNFADFMIGMWGGLELSVDPYTGQSRGQLRFNAFQDVDFVIRRPESFCYGKAA